MKQPTAPDLYPELPIEDGQNYRLQKITEIEKTLINERDKRKSLYKKYKRGVNVTDGVDTSLISTSVVLAGIGIAFPILLPIQIAAVVCGSLGGLVKLIRRKLTTKSKKHYEIKTMAECKLNSIKDLISKSLTDGQISADEFKLILDELEKFNEMKLNKKEKVLKSLPDDERKKLIEETENRMNKMAEGGYEFDNPEFKNNDYDEEEEEEETSFQDDEEFQNNINKEFEKSRDLSENDAKIRKKETTKKMIKQFYKKNGETIRNEEGFFVGEDHNGRQILYVKDEKGNDIALTYYQKGVLKFYKFSTLQKEYSVNFVRDVLGVDDYKISDNLREARADFQDFQRTIKSPIRELDNIEIPLQEISTQQEGQELLEIASNEETHVKEIETSFIEQGTSFINEETQTYMTKREMDGIISAMTSVKEEIANELTKLNETNKDLAKENAKLEQAKEDNDEFQIDRISSRIRELESERSARLEVININKEKLRSQVNRFKQTIHKMLNEDKTLGERIRTLFREQGITIVSVLTAFGMIIGVIVEAFTGGTTSPSPSPSPSKGKLAAALPGIIGSIVSWLLSATKDVVNWFANNLWALLILVVGLLFTAA
ncbi:unnamed protein product [Mytilus edulis]|uniref:Uncharacterized protein n=1 Tax=Mytilus edulis TaxID=6550 RepID=A0A8S3SUX1_MYTED|nr:unnamed protein product [Mytilus edulis]